MNKLRENLPERPALKSQSKSLQDQLIKVKSLSDYFF